MEITGKIIAALEPVGGVSARSGSEWKKQEFVIETHDQYPKKCVFTVFGADRLSQFNIQVGDELTVSFDIDAHEWNGRWFNDIRAFRVDQAANAGIAAPAGAPAAAPVAAPMPTAADAPFAPAPDFPAEGSASDLPF